jgi:putative membrane protein
MLHYLKKNLKHILVGMAIGTAAIIPGISGGTIAVLLKVYDKIIASINTLFSNFKHSILFLIPIIIGLGLSILSLTIPMMFAFANFPLPVVSLFAGLILGGTFSLHKELPKKFNLNHSLILGVSFLVASLLGLFSIIGNLDGTRMLEEVSISSGMILMVVGFLGVWAFIVPGVSGSMLMLSIGFYIPILNLIRQLMVFNFTWPQLFSFAFLAIGALLGLVFISKLMGYLMKHHRPLFFVGVLGFVLGSIISLYINQEIVGFYAEVTISTILLSVTSLVFGFFISRKLEGTL